MRGGAIRKSCGPALLWSPEPECRGGRASACRFLESATGDANEPAGGRTRQAAPRVVLRKKAAPDCPFGREILRGQETPESRPAPQNRRRGRRAGRGTASSNAGPDHRKPACEELAVSAAVA